MPYVLKDVVSVFANDSVADSVMSGLIQAWLERICTDLNAELAKQPDRAAVADICRDFREMDAAARLRFLASPIVSEFLEDPNGHAFDGPTPGTDPILLEVARSVRAERILSDVRLSGATAQPVELRRIESPLGDVTGEYDPLSQKWLLATRPCVAGAVTVDVDSALAKRYEPQSGVFCNPRDEMNEEECDLAIAKLERAIALIDRASPVFGTMIRTFTRRIVLRKSRGTNPNPDREDLPTASEFRPVHSGCVRLLNAHSDAMDLVLCMEALVHETMHSYISCYEELEGKITSTYVQVRPMSPWSGNLIPNHSIAHAIFVYYALWQMYEGLQPLLAELSDQERAQVAKRHADVRAGFLIDRPLSELFFLDTPPADGLFDVIDGLQASVKAASGFSLDKKAPLALGAALRPPYVLIDASSADPVARVLRDRTDVTALDVSTLGQWIHQGGLGQPLIAAFPDDVAAMVQGRTVINRNFSYDRTAIADVLAATGLNVLWADSLIAELLNQGAFCTHDTSIRGVSRSLLPLNSQWFLIKRMQVEGVSVPRFEYGFGRVQPPVDDFERPLQKSVWSLFDWTQETKLTAADAEWHKFYIDRPTGTPVVLTFVGELVTFVFPRAHVELDARVRDRYALLASAAREAFKSVMGEALTYLQEDGTIVFCAFSPLMATSGRYDWFESFLLQGLGLESRDAESGPISMGASSVHVPERTAELA